MTISSTPRPAAVRRIVSSAGIVLSPPSRPKRLVPGNLTWRNCSKPSASVSCSRISRLSSAVEFEQAARTLDPGLDPGLLLRVLDVHELDADRAGVGLAQDLHDLAQGGLLQAQHVVEVELAVEVGVGEAVALVVELGVVVVAPCQAQRVEVGQQVAAHTVGADQHDDPQVLAEQRLGGRVVETGGRHVEVRRRRPQLARAGCQRGAGPLEQHPVLGLERVEVGAPARLRPTPGRRGSGRKAPR